VGEGIFDYLGKSKTKFFLQLFSFYQFEAEVV
jgi:hypothetical protein